MFTVRRGENGKEKVLDLVVGHTGSRITKQKNGEVGREEYKEEKRERRGARSEKTVEKEMKGIRKRPDV